MEPLWLLKVSPCLVVASRPCWTLHLCWGSSWSQFVRTLGSSRALVSIGARGVVRSHRLCCQLVADVLDFVDESQVVFNLDSDSFQVSRSALRSVEVEPQVDDEIFTRQQKRRMSVSMAARTLHQWQCNLAGEPAHVQTSELLADLTRATPIRGTSESSLARWLFFW